MVTTLLEIQQLTCHETLPAEKRQVALCTVAYIIITHLETGQIDWKRYASMKCRVGFPLKVPN